MHHIQDREENQSIVLDVATIHIVLDGLHYIAATLNGELPDCPSQVASKDIIEKFPGRIMDSSKTLRPTGAV